MIFVLLIALLQATTASGPAGADDPTRSRIERIADVRIDADGNSEPDRMGDTVTIAGRAASSSTTLHREYTFFFMQDPSGGIALFAFDALRDVATGDSLVVTGVVRQYRGLSQLHVLELRVVPGPRRVPEPVVIEEPFGDLERYEGQLVEVRGRIKGRDSIAEGRFALVGSESSLDGLQVFVAQAHSSPPRLESLRVGDEVVLRGLLAQHDVEPPYDTRYQIFPRSQEDLHIAGFSRARAEVVLLWGGALLLVALLWLALTRLQVRRRTRELKATARRFEALIENAFEMIFVIGADRRITFASRGVERVLGWTAAERVGGIAFDIVHPEDVEAVRHTFEELATRPHFRHVIEFRARHRDGTYRTLSAVAQNLLTDPATAGIVVNARDVSHQQSLELQLLQSKKLEAIGRVAGGIAHDFNNLMTVVRGHTNLLLAGPRDEDDVVTGLAEIDEAAVRASELTGQLLAFSRKQVLRPRVVDVAAVLRGMEKLLRRLIGEDIAIEFRVAPDLGNVLADPTQLEQVFMNLAVNARDAMPDGGTLSFGMDNVDIAEFESHGRPYDVPPAEYVVITVRDDGVGIPSDVIEHIFDPFFTTKQESGGTGLGLATVYGIVKQSGGHIWVESDAEGTSFHVYLPRAAGAADARPAEAVPAASARGGAILLVEDERAVRAMTQRILERAGYQVLSAANGVDALQLFDVAPDAPIDLILTDVVMPHMGGRELAGHMARIRPEARLLFMSGYTDDVVLQRGVMSDGRQFLAKPFSPDQLLERVAGLMAEPEGAGI